LDGPTIGAWQSELIPSECMWTKKACSAMQEVLRHGLVWLESIGKHENESTMTICILFYTKSSRTRTTLNLVTRNLG
jgi:hypothetical protein